MKKIEKFMHFYQNHEGNVGIGTTFLNYKLHIVLFESQKIFFVN